MGTDINQNEEQHLKNLAKGSNKSATDSSSAEGSGDVNREDDDDQSTRFEAGRSRPDRRVTRYVV